MQSLKLYAKQDLRLEKAEEFALTSSDDVIIEVKAAGICGSDLSRYAKLGPYVKGTTFGHEFSGVVVNVGQAVTHVRPGDRVAGCPAFPCGSCQECKKGNPARCEKLTVLGAFRSGAFASRTKLPAANVIPIPDEVDFDTASLIEPSAVVAHAYYRSSIRPGDTVAVMGCGNIGLLAIQWAKLFGASTVYAIDIDSDKLTIAEKMGADATILPNTKPAHEAIQELEGEGVDVAVESAGSVTASAQVLALPKKGGEVVFMGIPYSDISIERFYYEKIVRNELRILGGWNAVSSPFPGKEWSTSIEAVRSGHIKVDSMITHRLPLEKGPEVFDRILLRDEFFSKVLLYPSP
ncbi:galactitol-1-phosphate 5-dehydrogenase [Salibacterium salarium]|uniref:Galactitol-1-phosphate 5-dehydrogenase n=1 Tax=Salibacterium salarium TaxID=284579 RepID=A0A3R9QNC9_9BACI|nr:galactitol-1-phosphate 5-dehydrogenase [Salibacterium salarium]RSL34083.1 galactitol-1-phosphate 5-dehydrogenase [Salibacterium salarium]